MSVNALLFTTPSRRTVFILFLLVIAAGGIGWYFWPNILLQSVIWQKQLHQEMTSLLLQTKENSFQAGVMLSVFSLAYGILHAAGPGHGKVIIATFLATHPTQLRTSIRLTLLAALLQGFMAILLVTLLLVILQLSSRQLHLSSYWLEKSSYLLVMVLGTWLCWRNGRWLWHHVRPVSTIYRLRPLTHDCQHHAHCGCGHQHIPDSHKLTQAVGWKTQLLLVLSMGFRPCSGAIMMLLFSKVIGVYRWGVFSALVMAAGTALTVTAMALLVQSARALALRINRVSPGRATIALPVLALLGGTVLILAGGILWLGAQPEMSGGIGPRLIR